MRAVALVALVALGCAPTVRPVSPPIAPSTHRDPPSHVPPPAADPRTGALVGVTVSGGEDQARELLVIVVSAIRDGDFDALRDVLGPEVHRGGALRGGRSSSGMDGAQLAEQLIQHARLSRVSPDARFEELVDVASIRVEPVASLAREPLPPELRPGDVVVRFTATPAGRRALQLLAPDGNGALVVRPGEDPRVVAR